MLFSFLAWVVVSSRRKLVCRKAPESHVASNSYSDETHGQATLSKCAARPLDVPGNRPSRRVARQYYHERGLLVNTTRNFSQGHQLYLPPFIMHVFPFGLSATLERGGGRVGGAVAYGDDADRGHFGGYAKQGAKGVQVVSAREA